MKGRVLVTGAAARLGAAVVEEFGGGEVIAYGRPGLDVTDPIAVRDTIAAAAPSVVINCAAFNDVDGAEDRASEALAVNAFAVRSLARAAETCGATFVHFGTDFVFDGAADAPYGENALPSPRSVYGLSKLLGEWFALESPRAFVLRVESLFGAAEGWTGRRGSVDAILDGLEQRSGGASLHRPGGVAELRARRGPGGQAPDGIGRRAGTLSLRELGARDLARHRGGSGTANGGAAAAPAHHGRAGGDSGPRGRGSARCPTRSSRRRAARCPPGTMRCSDGSRRGRYGTPG